MIRRLVRFDLPDWLRLRIGDQSLLEVQLEFPSRGAANFDEVLRQDLGMKLTLRESKIPSWEDVTARLGERTGRVLFKLTFTTSDWAEDGPARVERLLESWQLCGDLDPTRTPIVCVQVVYESLPLAPRLERWLGLARNANDDLRDYLGRLEAELKAGAKYPKVGAVRLAPLSDVTSGDLLTWQGLAPVQAFRPGADFTVEIDALFNGNGGGNNLGLPMVSVVPYLREWLKRYAKGV